MSYETYALIKDNFQCEPRGEIRPRGLAYPVDTYLAIGPKKAAGVEGTRMHVALPHLNLAIDPSAMNTEERNEARTVLERAWGGLS